MVKKILIVFGWIAVVGMLFGVYWMVHTEKTKSSLSKTQLELSFLSLKEDADCILLQQGEFTVLLDTGEQQDGQTIVDYLKEKSVTNIEYLILTHPDKDHIGGALDVIEQFDVKNVIQPYYPKNNENLERLNENIKKKGIPILYPTITRKFSVGDMSFLVYPPLEKYYESDNNYSLVTLVRYGEVGMLFAGDAQKKRLEELLLVNWKKIDLLKIPYHGRASMNSDQFIRAISPTCAVVTSNDADEMIKETCKELNTQVFYTGEGNKVFYSDGHVLK